MFRKSLNLAGAHIDLGHRSIEVHTPVLTNVSSTRVKESLNKAALLAEIKHLAEKQELMRQELEVSIVKQSPELKTKLSITTAEENVLCEFEAGSSLLSVSRVVKSETGIDTISPSVKGRQSVKQAGSTPMYTSPSSHLPGHASVSIVSNLGSTSCPSVTVPLSTDTISLTAAVGTTVHPSISTANNLGSTSCPSVTVPLSTDTVSLTTAVGTTVHPSVSTVSNLDSTSCLSVTVPLPADTVSLTTAVGTAVHPSVSTVSKLSSTSCPSITAPPSTDTVNFTTAIGTPVNVSVSTCRFSGSTSLQFNMVHPSTDSFCQLSAVSHVVNWSVNSVPLHGSITGSPAVHLPADTVGIDSVYFRGVDVSPNFVSPSISTVLSHMLNNVCVSNSVGMFVDNGGTLMSVPRGSLCMTGNSVCMPTGAYLPNETGTSRYCVTSTPVTARYRGDSGLDPSSPEFVPAEVGLAQVHGAVNFVRSDSGLKT